jgi:hypothetical protein
MIGIGPDYQSNVEYRPTAIYYEEADSLEYVRVDAPAIYRRIDDRLTLILSMASREPIGFQVKGFRNFYIRHLQLQNDAKADNFLSLMLVLETAISLVGDGIFEKRDRILAYEKALNIATEDAIELHDLPKVA